MLSHHENYRQGYRVRIVGWNHRSSVAVYDQVDGAFHHAVDHAGLQHYLVRGRAVLDES